MMNLNTIICLPTKAKAKKHFVRERERESERERRDERYSVNFVVFALDVGGREKSGRCCRRRRMGEEAS
jgi:hypothetical protein